MKWRYYKCDRLGIFRYNGKCWQFKGSAGWLDSDINLENLRKLGLVRLGTEEEIFLECV